MVRYLLLLVLFLTGCASRPTLVQYSTINALLAGVYDGDMTFGELRRHGDFGLGTFNALDGEMIALDGRYYQITADGAVKPVTDNMQTPFAAVTPFHATLFMTSVNALNFTELEQALDRFLPSTNAFYAIKITGNFPLVKARSVPRQAPPYAPLIEAAKHQTVFEFRNVTGTLVGFRTPDVARGLNVTGYHFHFLTADRRAGGHVLDCELSNGKVEIQRIERFLTILSARPNEIGRDRSSELEAVEKGHETHTTPR